MVTKNSINSSNPIEISKGGTNASSMATADGIVYYDGTKLVTTSAGTIGYYLTSNGAGSAPTYQAPGAVGAGWILISTQTASTSSSISWTSGISSSYRNYILTFNLTIDGYDEFRMQFSTNGGSSWLTTGYDGYRMESYLNSASIGGSSYTNVYPYISGRVTSGTGALRAEGQVFIFGLTNSSYPSWYSEAYFYKSSSPFYSLLFGGGAKTSASGISGNALRIITTSSTTFSGTASLYALAE